MSGSASTRRIPTPTRSTWNKPGLACRIATTISRDGKEMDDTRAAYKKYLASMLTLAGLPDAQKRADAVYALEAAMAKVEWSHEERRDADQDLQSHVRAGA